MQIDEFGAPDGRISNKTGAIYRQRRPRDGETFALKPARAGGSGTSTRFNGADLDLMQVCDRSVGAIEWAQSVCRLAQGSRRKDKNHQPEGFTHTHGGNRNTQIAAGAVQLPRAAT